MGSLLQPTSTEAAAQAHAEGKRQGAATLQPCAPARLGHRTAGAGRPKRGLSGMSGTGPRVNGKFFEQPSAGRRKGRRQQRKRGVPQRREGRYRQGERRARAPASRACRGRTRREGAHSKLLGEAGAEEREAAGLSQAVARVGAFVHRSVARGGRDGRADTPEPKHPSKAIRKRSPSMTNQQGLQAAHLATAGKLRRTRCAQRQRQFPAPHFWAATFCRGVRDHSPLSFTALTMEWASAMRGYE